MSLPTEAANDDAAASVNRPYSPKFKYLLIPFGLLVAAGLSGNEKMLLAEIYSLQKSEERGCWASNSHFGGLLGVTDRQVRAYISKLEKAGHIRSANRSSKRRQLWIGDELRAQIESTCADPQENGSKGTSGLSDKTRNDGVSAPGNETREQEAVFHDTRKQASTENTLRGQQENTNEKKVGGFLIPDWMPAPLWEEWVRYLARDGRPAQKDRLQAQIQKLETLEDDGYPFRDVMKFAMENGWKDFYPLKKRPLEYTNRRGYMFWGGSIVRAGRPNSQVG